MWRDEEILRVFLQYLFLFYVQKRPLSSFKRNKNEAVTLGNWLKDFAYFSVLHIPIKYRGRNFALTKEMC
jgi:hypothetical protein